MTGAEFGRDLDELAEVLDEIKTELHGVHTQTRATNGRVAKLEGKVHEHHLMLSGDPDRHTPGLVVDAQNAGRMFDEWQQLKRTGKWVAVTLGGNLVAVGVAVVTGGIG